jgi:N utilization substance protein B
MKTVNDPRHKTRVSRVQSLFSYTFQSSADYPEISDILSRLSSIDSCIAKAAPEWPLPKINKLDLAVLRMSTYELLYSDVPKKVIIDEAVEIAKTYGSENSSSFVNGVLGTILKNKDQDVKS